MKTLFIGIFACFTILTTSNCQKKEDVKIENDGREVISLDDIPDNPEYLNMPFEGITWKLVGFGVEGCQSINLPQPKPLGDESTILFKDYIITGRTYVNKIYGEYEINIVNNTVNIIDIISTRAGEEEDGYKYFYSLNSISSYKMTLKGMQLFYSAKAFLLFEIY